MEHVIDLARPVGSPPGRDLLLPGRGRTFVRHLRRGRRPTVVLLHGLAATADVNWGASYGALGRAFDIVTIDHRGHGRGLRTPDRFTLEACADDVAAVLGELDVETAIIAGYSMGGPIAQLVWRRHPEVVDGLVLCATSDVFSDSNRDRAMFAAATGAALLARSGPSKAALQLLGDTVTRRRRMAASLGGHVMSHDWAQVLEASRAVGRFDSRTWLPDVDVPLAVVTTRHDAVVPTSRQRAMAARLPVVADVAVDGGHCACLHPGSAFVRAFVEMCRAVDRAARPAALRRAG
jgi:3-oxoadipate enol-lactonase